MKHLRNTTRSLLAFLALVYLSGCGGSSASTSGNSTESGSLAAPSGLSATLLSNTEIQLSWTNTSTVQTSNDIYVSTDGATFSLVTSALGNSNVQVLTDADPGITYYFYVIADESGTDSAASNTATIATGGTTSGIYVPTSGGPAAPTSLAFKTVSTTSWKLTWTNAASTYETIYIFASSTGSIYQQIGTASGTDTSVFLSNLVAGDTYYFEIQAVDADGNYSSASNVITATP